jgi:hypothetical protein
VRLFIEVEDAPPQTSQTLLPHSSHEIRADELKPRAGTNASNSGGSLAASALLSPGESSTISATRRRSWATHAVDLCCGTPRIWSRECGRRSMNAFRSYRAYRSNSWQDPEGRTSEQRVALGQPMLDSQFGE